MVRGNETQTRRPVRWRLARTEHTNAMVLLRESFKIIERCLTAQGLPEEQKKFMLKFVWGFEVDAGRRLMLGGHSAPVLSSGQRCKMPTDEMMEKMQELPPKTALIMSRWFFEACTAHPFTEKLGRAGLVMVERLERKDRDRTLQVAEPALGSSSRPPASLPPSSSMRKAIEKDNERPTDDGPCKCPSCNPENEPGDGLGIPKWMFETFMDNLRADKSSFLRKDGWNLYRHFHPCIGVRPPKKAGKKRRTAEATPDASAEGSKARRNAKKRAKKKAKAKAKASCAAVKAERQTNGESSSRANPAGQLAGASAIPRRNPIRANPDPSPNTLTSFSEFGIPPPGTPPSPSLSEGTEELNSTTGVDSKQPTVEDVEDEEFSNRAPGTYSSETIRGLTPPPLSHVQNETIPLDDLASQNATISRDDRVRMTLAWHAEIVKENWYKPDLSHDARKMLQHIAQAFNVWGVLWGLSLWPEEAIDDDLNVEAFNWGRAEEEQIGVQHVWCWREGEGIGEEEVVQEEEVDDPVRVVPPARRHSC